MMFLVEILGVLSSLVKGGIILDYEYRMRRIHGVFPPYSLVILLEKRNMIHDF